MNWEAAGAIGEIVGAIAVVATILYLAKQVTQTNRVTTASGARELQQQYAHVYTLICTDTAINQLVARLRDPHYEPNSEAEEEQVESFCLLLSGIWLTTAIAYKQGQIDEGMYRIYCTDVAVKLAKWPGIKKTMLEVINKYPEGEDHEIFDEIYK